MEVHKEVADEPLDEQSVYQLKKKLECSMGIKFVFNVPKVPWKNEFAESLILQLKCLLCQVIFSESPDDCEWTQGSGQYLLRRTQ